MADTSTMFSHYDHLFGPVVIFNLKQEVVYWNHQFVVFSRQPPRVLKANSNFFAYFESPDINLEEWLSQSLLGMEVRLTEEITLINLRSPDNTYHVVLKSFPVETTQGPFIGLVIHDLTIEKKLHDKYRDQMLELRHAHDQIVQADKLATIGEMTATISHEISNPLTIASGNCELIEAFLEASDVNTHLKSIKRGNEDIKESLERIHTIIKNMRNFLHRNEETKEYCDLKEIIHNAIEWLQSPINEGQIKITTKLQATDTVALVNKVKIEQTVINLVKNAIDALVDSKVVKPEIHLVLARQENDNALCLEIMDNGPGIAEENRESIFKPFFTTKGPSKGTGLGLPICSKIIEGHRGQLQLIDSPLGGANFRMTLPAIEAYGLARNDKSMRGINPAHAAKILVLDNEVQILNVLDKFLGDAGLVFIGSTDPHKALNFIGKMKIDLVLTDYSMPEFSGKDFALKAREMGFTGPILYMTGAKNASLYNEDKKELNLQGLLIKPFSREDVIKTLKMALGMV